MRKSALVRLGSHGQRFLLAVGFAPTTTANCAVIVATNTGNQRRALSELRPSGHSREAGNLTQGSNSHIWQGLAGSLCLQQGPGSGEFANLGLSTSG